MDALAITKKLIEDTMEKYDLNLEQAVTILYFVYKYAEGAGDILTALFNLDGEEE